MRNKLKSLVLTAVLAMSLGLAACLPDNSDPDKSNSAGQLSGTFYANGLGSVALAIQNAVVTSANWFSAMNSTNGLNLAALGVSSQGLGVPIKSYVCPNGAGNGVLQITWIDARDGSNKFALRGIGTDAGSIVGALRNRVAGNQIGVYNGTALTLVNGTTQALPGDCASAQIPAGAPVLAFNIETPAPPTANLARTEYRTVPCGNDDMGRAKRGTMVQSRTVMYSADGAITYAGGGDGWSSDANSMGQCMNDAIVEITQRDFMAGAGTVNMNNFAALALRDLLQTQLQMDCTKSTVRGAMAREQREGTGANARTVATTVKDTSKAIDTCPLLASMEGMAQQEEQDTANEDDSQNLWCKGSTPLILRQFHNLVGNGVQRTNWTDGNATLVRVLDNKAMAGGKAKRYKWVGTRVNCTGYQTFFATCGIIPGNPTPYAQRASNKFTISPITGYRVHRSWLNKVFGVCFLGSCVSVEGGEVYNLNPAYFSGIDLLQAAGTTTRRSMGVFDLNNEYNPQNWINPETFLPRAVPKSIWSIPENYCLWRERVMIANCPFHYDPTMQGDWDMEHITPTNARPVAIDPGIASDGSDTGTTYAQVRAEGHMVAQVVLHWKKKNIKGTKRWDETFGPGLGAYIKSWNGVPVNDIIVLSPEQADIRNESCENVAFQLDAYGVMVEKDGLQQVANGKMLTAQEIRDREQAIANGYINQRDNYQASYDAAIRERDRLNAQGNNQMNAAYAAWAEGDRMAQHNETATYTCGASHNEWVDTSGYVWQGDGTYTWVPYDYYYDQNYYYYYDYYYYDNYGYYQENGQYVWVSSGYNQTVCDRWDPPHYYSDAEIYGAYEQGNNNYYAALDSYAQASQAEANAGTYQSYRDQWQSQIDAHAPTLNTAIYNYTDANNKYLVAYDKYLKAKEINDAHLTARPGEEEVYLTSEELSLLAEYQSRVCTSASGTLDLDSQQNYKQACIGYYGNPQPFSKVQSIGLFCDTTFNRDGDTLSFKISSNTSYSDNVQTTLLNKDGVMLAWRPVLEGNRFAGDEDTALVTRQRGFTDPLMCARSEYRYIQWPVIENYWQCGGKGGCRLAQRSSSCTVIESTAREWSGLSYDTGTWSQPQTVCITPWGTYGSCSQLPNPYQTWSSGCTLPVTAPPVAAPPPPPATSPPQSSGMSCTDECGETKSDGATWCRAGVNGIGHGRRCSNGVIEELTGVSGLGCDAGGTFQCQ